MFDGCKLIAANSWIPPFPIHVEGFGDILGRLRARVESRCALVEVFEEPRRHRQPCFPNPSVCFPRVDRATSPRKQRHLAADFPVAEEP
jgi:hypothetical protein